MQSMKNYILVSCLLLWLLGCTTPRPAAVQTPSQAPPSSAAVPQPLKVAFIYVGPVGDAGWNYEHDLARQEIQKLLPEIETSYVENVPEGADATKVIRDLAQAGNKIIFATSFGFMDPTLEVAREYPDTIFLHCSGYKTAPNVGTYFGKIEEPRYLSGIVAGLMTRKHHIGYVAAHPIPEVIRGINAFTLGVRSVAPNDKVHVVWTNSWYDPAKERQAAESLLDVGCDIIAQHQDTPAAQQAAQARGAYGVGYNSDMSKFAPKAILTCPVWHWSVYYLQAINLIRSGQWKSGSYWGGMKEGLVDLSPLADIIPLKIKNLISAKRSQFISGKMNLQTIFRGPLKDQTGKLRIIPGKIMTRDEILHMNWFVQGVEGVIPSGH